MDNLAERRFARISAQATGKPEFHEKGSRGLRSLGCTSSTVDVHSSARLLMPDGYTCDVMCWAGVRLNKVSMVVLVTLYGPPGMG